MMRTPGPARCPARPITSQSVQQMVDTDDGSVDPGDTDEPDDTNLPVPTCNDTRVDAGEFCDDGNNVDGDGCEADCTLTPSVCGNGAVGW